MADLVQVGIMFMKIFGRDKGLNFYKSTEIPPGIYERVVAGLYRGTGPYDKFDPLSFTIS